ncbi:MAG: molybdopterin-dependent oxidoreductase [Hyphomicrobiales bacterium]
MAALEPVDRSLHTGAARPESLDGWTISIGGLVARPCALTVPELHALGRPVEVRPGVRCPEGVATRGSVYTGIALEDVLRHAGPRPEGRYIAVHSGPYATGFKLESLGRRGAVLAFERNGADMTWDDGGPVRLVFMSGACFDTVKWVDRVTVEPNLAAATALDFVRRRRGMVPPE